MSPSSPADAQASPVYSRKMFYFGERAGGETGRLCILHSPLRRCCFRFSGVLWRVGVRNSQGGTSRYVSVLSFVGYSFQLACDSIFEKSGSRYVRMSRCFLFSCCLSFPHPGCSGSKSGGGGDLIGHNSRGVDVRCGDGHVLGVVPANLFVLNGTAGGRATAVSSGSEVFGVLL